MRVAVTGAGGLVGAALVPALAARGHRVTRLVRRAPRAADERAWDPRFGLDDDVLRGVDAIVHLAGESIGAGRWTTARRRAILESRAGTTRRIAEAIARAAHPPILIVASAVGYYGDCGDEPLTETSAPGAGFLADVTRAWEAATDPARAAGVRVVHVRSGLVLSRRGGALARLLPVFRAGLGGRLGNGRQWVSWIHVDDLVAAFARALEGDAITGPINAVAPNPVRQRDFAAALGRALRRPAWLPTPAVALRAALGAMADELLLFSQRALPERLAGAGFRWTHGDIGPALESLLRPGTGFG